MTRINFGERNQVMHSIQAELYKENTALEIMGEKEEKPVNSNESAKREMAEELMVQGFSDEAICRILNLAPDQLPITLRTDAL